MTGGWCAAAVRVSLTSRSRGVVVGPLAASMGRAGMPVMALRVAWVLVACSALQAAAAGNASSAPAEPSIQVSRLTLPEQPSVAPPVEVDAFNVRAAADAPSAVLGTAADETTRAPAPGRVEPQPSSLSAARASALTSWIQGRGWRRFSRQHIGGGDQGAPLLSIAELPNPSGNGSRPQRSLRVRSNWAQQAMRSLGVEASDCAVHLRAPSRIGQSRDGVRVDIQAQVRLGCRF